MVSKGKSKGTCSRPVRVQGRLPHGAVQGLPRRARELQLLLMAPGGGGHQTELVRRIYRNTPLFESDLLAELDLPHSGAAQFEGHVGLPGGFAGGNARRGRARLPAHAVVRGPAGAAAILLCARAAAAAVPGADRPEAALLRVQGHHLPPLHLLHF
ncbi:hypothetical protein MY1884_003292 [Beauveria asiatica]